MVKTKTIIVLCVAAALAFSLTGCLKGGTGEAKKAYKPETLVWWRVWDNQQAVDGLISAYRALHPNVDIEYRKLRYEEYENELLEALAEDRGPDIFSIHNTWTQRYKSKLSAAPAQTQVPIKRTVGTVKKEEMIELITKPTITPGQVRKKFLEPVAQDVVMYSEPAGDVKPQEKVWGLPLNMDTLVLFYNKDLLSNAGIAEPAKNWVEFQEHVKKITKIDEKSNEILISGAGLGTAKNVTRNFDILSLLMMQNLTPMIDDKGKPVFDRIPAEMGNVEIPPGIGALEYYTQFSSPLFEGYCWNDKMPNSLEAFISGKVGYFFGYSYHRDQIIAKAPKLKFSIAPMPQVGEGQKVNYANYWVETVSNKTKAVDYAWDFLQFITAEENVAIYLDANKKTTALKSTKLINQELADENLEAAAGQLLTARSWYHGKNPAAAEAAFAEMIDSLVTGALPSDKAIIQAVQKVNFSMYK